MIPIDIFCGEAGRVRLRGAGVPEQFIEVAPLRVELAGDYSSVFLSRDGALGFEDGPGPLQARNNGFQEPIHAERVVVDAAQVNVGRDFAVG